MLVRTKMEMPAEMPTTTFTQASSTININYNNDYMNSGATVAHIESDHGSADMAPASCFSADSQILTSSSTDTMPTTSCNTHTKITTSTAENKETNLEGLEFDGETVLCRVCGDKASGFHYGVHACEGCKGFFRRSIQQKIQYRPCLKNQQCNIMRVNRNRCQYCRLKKCISVGMSRDAVRFGRVPKKEKAKIMEVMQKANSHSQNSAITFVLENEHGLRQKIIEAHISRSGYTRSKLEAFCRKAMEVNEFISCPAHKACPLNPVPETGSDKKWDDFSEFFTPAIKNVVDFAKNIPGFDVLCQEDQVTLLKAGTFEVLLVQLAPLFVTSEDTMLFINGKLFKRTSSVNGSNAGFLLDSMFDFAERVNQLHLTDEEIALFSALVIIASDRPGLKNPEMVEKIQDRVRQALQQQMSAHHRQDMAAFAKLLLKIPDLRTLNTLHSEKLLGLSVHAGANNAEMNGINHENTTESKVGLEECPHAHTLPETVPLIPPTLPSSMDTNNNSQALLQSWSAFHRQHPVFQRVSPQQSNMEQRKPSFDIKKKSLIAQKLLAEDNDMDVSAPRTSPSLQDQQQQLQNALLDERVSAFSQSAGGVPKMMVTGPPGIAVESWLQQQQEHAMAIRQIPTNHTTDEEVMHSSMINWRRRSQSGLETPSEASRSNSPVNVIDTDSGIPGSLPPSNRSSPHMYDPWGEPGAMHGEPHRKRAYSAAAAIAARRKVMHNQSQPGSHRASPSREMLNSARDAREATEPYPEPPRKRAYSYGAESKIHRLWLKKKENFLNIRSAFSSTESITANFSKKLSVANEEEEMAKQVAREEMQIEKDKSTASKMPTLTNALSKPPLDSNNLALGHRMMGMINESMEKGNLPIMHNDRPADMEEDMQVTEIVPEPTASQAVQENALNSLQQMVHGKPVSTVPAAQGSPIQNMTEIDKHRRASFSGQPPDVPIGHHIAPLIAESQRRNSMPIKVNPRHSQGKEGSDSEGRISTESDPGQPRLASLKEKILQRVSNREAQEAEKQQQSEQQVQLAMKASMESNGVRYTMPGGQVYQMSQGYPGMVQQSMMMPSYNPYALAQLHQVQAHVAAMQMHAQQQLQQQQQMAATAERQENTGGTSPLNLKKEKS